MVRLLVIVQKILMDLRGLPAVRMCRGLLKRKIRHLEWRRSHLKYLQYQLLDFVIADHSFLFVYFRHFSFFCCTCALYTDRTDPTVRFISTMSGSDFSDSESFNVLKEWSRITPPVDRHLATTLFGRYIQKHFCHNCNSQRWSWFRSDSEMWCPRFPTAQEDLRFCYEMIWVKL